MNVVELPSSKVPNYCPPCWLPDGHSQTIYPALFGHRPSIDFLRESWETPDGDVIAVDWLIRPSNYVDNQMSPILLPKNSYPEPVHNTSRIQIKFELKTPLVVMFHGLEGSSSSHYARTLMQAVIARGWNGVIPHFRGCGGTLNRSPRFYHSGDSAEANWILQRLHTQTKGPILASGISLGGNLLLRWLGERQNDAAKIVQAACAISAPLDLLAVGHALSRGFNMLYTHNFLKTLKKKSLAKLMQYPNLFDRYAMLSARNLSEFDNVVTAPLHGFKDALDYYKKASSKSVLGEITVPTLLLNARNDPFQPATALPEPREVGNHVTLLQPKQGGHVGFMTSPFPGDMTWMPETVLTYFDNFLSNA
ncbi:YheT family hydrolase [Candidatus Pandoraea novymonadis]|uniref:AB hydrolase-1 domain-containing protein n=1 Tax=Candidatus Pandoraea novymonadis TaxID=1808959 RepID=A0ABX5FDH2_9BURK|nr:alpha/beta fold hydrolase [Candidatus Pandoraea novymonadis]PSB91790.1 hypothetical protein BZL35_00003 [Candidatus Pandoraea novymonadis]